MILFLDACVLYPPLCRALLLGVAEAGLMAPRVSGRVLGEWVHAAGRGGLAAEAAAEAAARALLARFPDALVTGWEGREAALRLPDAADAHVLAAAVEAGAAAIVTFNLRDFPARRLAPLGLAARHPDGLLWEFLSEAPGVLRPLIGRLSEDDPRRALKRAQLPRTAKAYAPT